MDTVVLFFATVFRAAVLFTQLLIERVSVISLEVERPRHEDYHHCHPVPRLRMCGGIPPFPLKFSLRDAYVSTKTTLLSLSTLF
jgi:hypothetical protein